MWTTLINAYKNILSLQLVSPMTSNIDSKEVTYFSLFVKQFKAQTIMWLLLLSFKNSYNGMMRFNRARFPIMQNIYIITFDSKSIQNKNLNVLPQNADLLCLMPHMRVPSQFRNINFNSPFHHVNCSNIRKIAVSWNVQHTNSPLYPIKHPWCIFQGSTYTWNAWRINRFILATKRVGSWPLLSNYDDSNRVIWKHDVLVLL